MSGHLSDAHRTIRERDGRQDPAIHARMVSESSRRHVNTRDIIEDVILLVLVLLLGVIVGIRVERVYLNEPEPISPRQVETSGH